LHNLELLSTTTHMCEPLKSTPKAGFCVVFDKVAQHMVQLDYSEIQL